MRCRTELIATARKMLDLGLVTGTYGNVSCRIDDRILITPSNLPYEGMTTDDLVVLSRTGEVIEGHRIPSSEYRLHVGIYARIPDARAIVHTHSPAAVAFAARSGAQRSFPAEPLSDDLHVAPFRPAGTQELADGAVRCLIEHGGRAAILQDHGAVCIGRDLADALEICIEVEHQAARAVRPFDAAEG